MTAPHKGFDPDGPVFVSYRQTDGTPLATTAGWALRGEGIPVWRDTDDLLPGDFDERIEQAIDDGISGAVIVVTPNIAHSRVVRTIEGPRLVKLHRSEPRFSLAVVNGLARLEDGQLDFRSPDDLLGLVGPDAILHNTKQYEPHDDGLGALAKEMARRRMQEFRLAGATDLPISVQSRAEPSAEDAAAGLVVRYPPPKAGQRYPTSESFRSHRRFLRDLPALVTTSGATAVAISGGAHLSLAFGLGVALPEPRHIPVTVTDNSGTWTSTRSSHAVALNERVVDRSAHGTHVAVMVDLVPQTAGTDAFDYWVDAHIDDIRATVHISGSGQRIVCDDGQPIAQAIADIIRTLTARVGQHTIGLFLRTPFPLAVLLGRLLNTLTVNVFEWDDSTHPDRYLPAVTYRYGTDPVTDIHL